MDDGLLVATKDGSMFNYQTLAVDLHRPSRSMVVTIKSEASYLEKLFELEGLLNWCLDKVEITTLLLQGALGGHHLSPTSDEFGRLENDKIEKLANKFQKLSELLLLIPSTTIVDLHKGGGGFGQDWALAADILLADDQAHWSFTGSKSGMPFFAGGLLSLAAHGLLGHARSALAKSKTVDLKKMATLGLPLEFYNASSRDYIIADLIRDFHSQAPLVRLQQKKACLQMLYPQIEQAKKIEREVLGLSILSQDWKEALASQLTGNRVQFKTAMEIREIIRSRDPEQEQNQ